MTPGNELREALIEVRKFIVIACGDEAPYVKIELKRIDAALAAESRQPAILTPEVVRRATGSYVIMEGTKRVCYIYAATEDRTKEEAKKVAERICAHSLPETKLRARLEEANLWKDRWHMSDVDVDWRKQRISALKAALAALSSEGE